MTARRVVSTGVGTRVRVGALAGVMGAAYLLAGCSTGSVAATGPPTIEQLNKMVPVTHSVIYNGISIGTSVKPVPGFFDAMLSAKQIANGYGISSMAILQVAISTSTYSFRAPLGTTTGTYYEADVEARYCANAQGFPGWVMGNLRLSVGGQGGILQATLGLWNPPTLIAGQWLGRVRVIGANQCVTGVNDYLVPASWYDSSNVPSLLPSFVSGSPYGFSQGYNFTYSYNSPSS